MLPGIIELEKGNVSLSWNISRCIFYLSFRGTDSAANDNYATSEVV